MVVGLFRLWVVSASTWILWVVFLFMMSGNVKGLVKHAGLVAYPPLIVLAFGAALVWVARGFR
jgi:hypothetical protein